MNALFDEGAVHVSTVYQFHSIWNRHRQRCTLLESVIWSLTEILQLLPPPPIPMSMPPIALDDGALALIEVAIGMSMAIVEVIDKSAMVDIEDMSIPAGGDGGS